MTMKRVTMVAAALLIALTFTSLGIYSYVQSTSQPPRLQTTNWGTVDTSVQRFMPLEYVHFSLEGHNVTLVAQLDTPYGNVSESITFSEQVVLYFICNDTSLVLHPRATIVNETMNGTAVDFNSVSSPREYVFNGIQYVVNYNRLSTANEVTFPKQVSANVSVTLSATLGPYWYVDHVFHITL